jgi:hypothetical protein
MYQKDVTQALTPSMPSGRGQELKARATASMAESVFGAVEQGVSIFQDVQQGKFTSEQADILSRIDEERTGLQKEGEKIKLIAPFFEGGAADDPALQEFKTRQERFKTAIEQFPDKAKEMRQRSSALLRSYIAQYPGMADRFRQVSADLTGINRLDLEPLRELWADVEGIEGRQKAAAQQEVALRDAAAKYFTDNGEDPVNARVRASKMPIEELQAAAASIAAGQREQARLEALVKTGGIEATKLVNNIILNVDSMMPLYLGNMMGELADMGVGRISAMDPAKLQDPKVKAVFEKGLGSILTALDKTEADSNKALLELSARGADPKAIKEARENLTSRMATLRKELTVDNVYLKAMAIGAGGDGSTLGKRLRELNAMRTALGGDATVNNEYWVTEIGSDKWTALSTKNPTFAGNVARIRRGMQAAMDGAPDEEYQAIISGAKTINSAATRPEAMPAPTTPTERALSSVTFEGAVQTLRQLKQGKEMSPDDINSALQVAVEQGSRLGSNSSRAREVLPLIRYALEKLPKDAQGAAVKLGASRIENYLYSPNSDMDIVKQAWESVKARPDTVVSFADETGVVPLKLRSITSRPNVTMQTRTGITSQPQQSVVGEVSADVLAAIDNKLLMMAALTGRPIEELRKSAMEELKKDGLPSQTRTSAVSSAAATRNNKPGVSLGEVVGVDVGGTALQGPASVVLRDLQLLVESTTDAATKTKLQAIIKDMQK